MHCTPKKFVHEPPRAQNEAKMVSTCLPKGSLEASGRARGSEADLFAIWVGTAILGWNGVALNTLGKQVRKAKQAK